MRTLRYALVAAIAGLIAFTVWRFWHQAEKPITPTISSSDAIDQSTSKAQVNVAAADDNTYAQISLKSRTREEAVKLWLERVEKDKKADWKVPIQFYGKVIDENSGPLPGANVRFQWTDLSHKGTAVAETASDSSGRFSLSGIQGKRLSVRVTKEGYYDSQNESYKSFEFSNPGEDIYYEPDSANPVLFQLRHRGIGAQLIKRSVKVVLPGDGTDARIDLTGGKIAESGDLEVQAWKPWPPKKLLPHYDWKVVLRINDGGFVETPEEFAFEAPEIGYNESCQINMSATAGDAWRVSVEKTLYFAFGKPRKYGRLHFRTSANSHYIFIDYVLNPSGSRNLEEAAEQANNGAAN